MLIQKNTFVVKQTSGFMRSFLHIDKVGIVERIFKRNGWSKYDVFIKNADRNFVVILFPDDEINIIFKDNQGSIFIAEYDNSEPIVHLLYKNDNNDDIYFDAFPDENQIHIFYTMKNKRTNSKNIFYQKIDHEFIVSPIDIIGKTGYEYAQPFVVYNSDKGNIYVAYQRNRSGTHILGYKMMNLEQKIWTKYQIIGESDKPFIDYSLLEVNNKIIVAYIKEEDSLKKAIYVYDSNSIITQNILYENDSILSCSMFLSGNKVWCTWISGNKLYGAFKLPEDSDLSNPPYEEVIKPDTISKGYYFSNNKENKNNFPEREFYIFNNSGPDYHVLPKIYNIGSRNKGTDESYNGYVSDQVFRKMQNYIEELKEKDRIIQKLKERLARFETNEAELPTVSHLQDMPPMDNEKATDELLGEQEEIS